MQGRIARDYRFMIDGEMTGRLGGWRNAWVGYYGVKDQIHVHDLQATILHQMGVSTGRYKVPDFIREIILEMHGQGMGYNQIAKFLFHKAN